MKNPNEIEQLVERFLNGETTLTEERILERFFHTHRAELPTMPEPLRIVAKMFDEFQQERENQPAKPKPLLRRWAVAACITIIFCLGVAAVTIYHFAPKATGEAPSSEVAATEVPAPKPDFFVFDNVEMEQVADTIAKHFHLTPVFLNKNDKCIRVYLKINKKKTINEVVEQLNCLEEFTVTVKGKRLIIK